MYVYKKAEYYKYIMKRIFALSDDIQEDCTEAETIEKKIKVVIYI